MFGLDDLFGGLFGGALKMFSNQQQNQYAVQNAIMQQQFTQANQRESEAFNREEAEKTRGFNAEQADIARQFSAGQQTQAEGFNASQAELNRQYQERMSSTAYQRATQDMRAAGINPMLAYQQGGAASPGGSAASVGAVGGSAASGPSASIGSMPGARVGDRASMLEGVISSAREAARLKPEIENLRQDTQTKAEVADERSATTRVQNAVRKRTEAETRTEEERAANVRADTEMKERQGERGRVSIGTPYGTISGDPYYHGHQIQPALKEFGSSARRFWEMINGP